MRPVPGPVFQALFIAGIAVLLAGGVQWQVGRKKRTNFNDQVYIEDSAPGNSTRYRVLVSREDTAGDYFTIEVLIRANAYGFIRDKPGSEAPHFHLRQTEVVRVKEGTLGYFVGHQTHVQAAEAGQQVVIRPGESHMLFNAGGGVNGSDLLLHITFKPARHGEQLFETLAGLGHDYESVLAVSPIQKWMTLGEAEVVLSEVPPGKWGVIQGYLVPFARKLGYRPFYSEFRTKRVELEPAQQEALDWSGAREPGEEREDDGVDDDEEQEAAAAAAAAAGVDDPGDGRDA